MIRLVALLAKKDGLSTEAFRNHYEAIHVPLIRSMIGDRIGYSRIYVDRSTLIGGTMAQPSGHAEFAFDVITQLAFADEAAFAQAKAAFAIPRNSSRIARDEEKFLERDRKLMFVTRAFHGD